MSTVIEDIIARKVLSSRGEETIEVDIVTPSSFGRAGAPAGKSRGKSEVVCYPKSGIEEAINKVEELIAPELVGSNADFQEEIDRVLHEVDGTKDFSNIGGNTAFAISIATAEAAANSSGLLLFRYLGGYIAHELPYPLGNVMSGGKHGGRETPEIQEFLVLPSEAKCFLDAAIANTKVHKRIGDVLEREYEHFNRGKSDEGAWICNITNTDALEILTSACEDVGDEWGLKSLSGIDVAASSLWNAKKGKYMYQKEHTERDSGEQLEYILELVKTYNIAYVEDPFHEDDYASTTELTAKTKNCLICGDDLFTTNTQRLERGSDLRAANAIIIKVNQIGTLTDAWTTTKTAKRSGYTPIMSHRSGSTCDWHIAHLAMAFGCPMIKTGVAEGSRTAKINELIRVEEYLGEKAKMAELRMLKRR